MKTMYIPKGQTVCYDTLETEHLVVQGCLHVTYGLTAKTISGNGVILAGTVSADDIHARELEAAAVYCLRLAAGRVQAAEVFASESAAVSCCLRADYVSADRLTVALHEVGKIDAREVISLPPRKRSLFRLLLASALRSAWVSLTMPHTEKVVNAEYRQAEEAEEHPEPEPQAALPLEEPKDQELNRIIGLFKLLRDSGYTLKIIPGTPEENAPKFDFATEHIDFPAA